MDPIKNGGCHSIAMWVFPKIMLPPNHPMFNRVFHEINHPFWGCSPYFWGTFMLVDPGVYSFSESASLVPVSFPDLEAKRKAQGGKSPKRMAWFWSCNSLRFSHLGTKLQDRKQIYIYISILSLSSSHLILDFCWAIFLAVSGRGTHPRWEKH